MTNAPCNRRRGPQSETQADPGREANRVASRSEASLTLPDSSLEESGPSAMMQLGETLVQLWLDNQRQLTSLRKLRARINQTQAKLDSAKGNLALEEVYLSHLKGRHRRHLEKLRSNRLLAWQLAAVVDSQPVQEGELRVEGMAFSVLNHANFTMAS
jgi:hypothetical protein